MSIPKKLTATNDVTGALIKSKGDNRDVYASGWDAIWGKKEQKRQDPPNDNWCIGCNPDNCSTGCGTTEYAQGGDVTEMVPTEICQNNLVEVDYAGILRPTNDLNRQVDTNSPTDDENVSKDVLRGHNEH